MRRGADWLVPHEDSQAVEYMAHRDFIDSLLGDFQGLTGQSLKDSGLIS